MAGFSAGIESQYEVNRLPDGRVIYTHVLVRETPEQRNVAIANLVVQPRFIPRRIHFDSSGIRADE